jgi:signal recognition particle subunit SRP19
MSLRSGDYFVIWCEYFDQDLTITQGRRLPLKLAIKSPDLKLLSAACKELKLPFIPEGGKSFPSKWWRARGRVLIEREKLQVSKQELILKIAKKMRTLVTKKSKK